MIQIKKRQTREAMFEQSTSVYEGEGSRASCDYTESVMSEMTRAEKGGNW